MKLYIVRHGATDWNVAGILQGNTDIPLNQKGQMQAKLVQRELQNKEIDVCISSPLKRAYETASIICNGKVDIVKDSRLEERELGELEGKSATLYDSKMYWNYLLNSSSHGVESIQNLFARVTLFVEELRSQYHDKNVLIVVHGAIVRALHYIVVGYNENTDFLSFDVPNCHVFEYEI